MPVVTGALPKDYGFDAYREFVSMQPGDVMEPYADWFELEWDFGLSLPLHSKAAFMPSSGGIIKDNAGYLFLAATRYSECG